ncbi:MAG: signal peptidase I [Oscillospiraceae bacterium]
MNGENNNINENSFEQNGNNKPKIADAVLEWAESFVFAMFVVILIFTFVLRTVVVVGDSMNPNFINGDRLIITHLKSSVEKGEILVMNSHGLNETIIKRCIGTEGDKVKIDYNQNKIWVNGKEIEDDYINGAMVDKEFYFDPQYMVESGVYEYTVPENKVFVMGDNRNHSADSRYSQVGFIDEEDILGKVVFRIYPFDSIGKISGRL